MTNRSVNGWRRGLAAAVLGAVAAAAQAPKPAPTGPAAVKPDDVVATVDGEKVTARQLQQLRDGAPQEFQAAARQSNRAFLKAVAGLLVLSKLAEQDKLHEKSPLKEQLAFFRMNLLANSFIAGISQKSNVTQPELQDYYIKNLDNYQEAQVRAIYIAFSSSPSSAPADPKAKKPLTESQAKVKAEGLVAQLRKGGDFAALAKAHSDDSVSAEKGGDLGGIKRNSTGLPAEVRSTVFGLKPGEVSDPLRQPAGFYIFRLEKIATTPYEEVAGTIAQTVQVAKVQAELNRILTTISITHDNEAFFNESPAPPAP